MLSNDIFFTEFQLYQTYSQTSGAIIVNNELQIIVKLYQKLQAVGRENKKNILKFW